MPPATTDSPMATMTTSPWRSTKCAGAISKLLWLSRLATHGVAHSRMAAAVHSTRLRGAAQRAADDHEQSR